MFLAIFNTQGEKINILEPWRRRYCGNEHDGIAVLDYDRPVCLFGNFAGFDG
jgi:hypothetical protein